MVDKLVIGETISKVARRLPFVPSLLQAAVRRAISDDEWRNRLNRLYEHTGPNARQVIHTLVSPAFRGKESDAFKGIWSVNFLGSEIRLPVDNQTAWLTWDQAVSILGHDIEIKQTYENLLKSKYRPEVFFDIGANYGTHSLLFLSQKVRVTSFEPNPACIEQFEAFCSLNNFEANIQAVAVGDEEGVATLWFPQNDTWLGTVVPSTKERLSADKDLNVLDVRVITLDSYVEHTGIHPHLIKIDTEGNEPSVLRGAERTIKNDLPLVIFECDKAQNRTMLFGIFQDLGYVISSLPLDEKLRTNVLDLEGFKSFHRNNFIAIPNKHAIALGSPH